MFARFASARAEPKTNVPGIHGGLDLSVFAWKRSLAKRANMVSKE